MSNWRVVFFTAVVAVSCAFRADAETCAQTLAPTDAIMLNLQTLYGGGQLSVQDLIAIRDGDNPLEKKRGVDDRTFAEVIAETVARLKQNPEVGTKLDDFIRQVSVQRETRDLIDEETKDRNLRTIFYDIDQPPAKVFRMANMPVTQWQYAMVMDIRPNPERSNHPAEIETYNEINQFLLMINNWSRADDKRIYMIFPNHIPFAHFRLPTEDEWEYVARNRGKWSGGIYPDGFDEKNLHQIAWQDKDGETHPVCELMPIVLDGDKLFYDLLGNVWEVTSKSGFDFSALRGGVGSINAGVYLDNRVDVNRSPRQSGCVPIGFRLVEDPP